MEELILVIHILVASFWIGGMLFMAIVLSPYVRKLPLDFKNKAEVYQEVGKRYSFWGTVIGLPVLFITGVFNAYFIGGIKSFNLFLQDLPYTNTLKLKIFLFIITTIIAVIHDFYFGPKAHLTEKYKKITRIFGITNLIIGILIIYFAVKLRLGG
ncbi:CopD family protein [Hydrogenothermus marinus]|uniref:Copper resistance protein D n=1 Tax=Hydrogenothermus marinus TaxID=133270 RepID=A0A3M0B7I2_9AQUI|nr:CopD family protein [Hydrogenothermus marinus]RMA93101.1 copper resistance protein D [Hydrogenothermus marinus]